jgi:hypothetical protein
MGTYTQTIVVGANTYTKQYTISNADLARFVAAVRGKYATPAAPLTTDSEAALAFFAQVLAGAKDLTRNWERDAAVATAAAGVSDITAT